MAIAWLQRMKAAGVPPDQAEAIASGPDERYVTKDYLDARLDARISQLLNDITWRMVGLGVVIITAVGLLDKLVRP